jgi:hypothetical protein
VREPTAALTPVSPPICCAHLLPGVHISIPDRTLASHKLPPIPVGVPPATECCPAPPNASLLSCPPCFSQPPVCTSALVLTAPRCRTSTRVCLSTPCPDSVSALSLACALPTLPLHAAIAGRAPVIWSQPLDLLLFLFAPSGWSYQRSTDCQGALPSPSSAAHGSLAERVLLRSRTVRGGAVPAPLCLSPILLITSDTPVSSLTCDYSSTPPPPPLLAQGEGGTHHPSPTPTGAEKWALSTTIL